MFNEHSFVRVNGRGNAWPVFLGGESRFYSNSSKDLSNASFSLIGCSERDFNQEKIKWEVLIDAGHHTVPFLIQNGNRIPNAVVLTHGHMDHTLGLDWVAQSRYRLSERKKKLKVYATIQVWDFVKQSYPHLGSIIHFEELLPANATAIKEVEGLKVTSYPVYHGENAKGASMLLFETPDNKKVVFTGDMLCPLLRKKDYSQVGITNCVFIDSNNRFPYPHSNHGSIINSTPDDNAGMYLQNWFDNTEIQTLILPHERKEQNKLHQDYFREFAQDWDSVSDISHTVMDFARITKIPQFYLIHFSGMEDLKYHRANPVSDKELRIWVEQEALKLNIETQFFIPETGTVVPL